MIYRENYRQVMREQGLLDDGTAAAVNDSTGAKRP